MNRMSYLAPCLDLELTIPASMRHLRDHLFQRQPTNQVLYTEKIKERAQMSACVHVLNRKQHWYDLNTGVSRQGVNMSCSLVLYTS